TAVRLSSVLPQSQSVLLPWHPQEMPLHYTPIQNLTLHNFLHSLFTLSTHTGLRIAELLVLQCFDPYGLSQLQSYSLCNASAGFAIATRTDCMATVNMATTMAVNPANANIHHCSSIR